MVHHPLTHSIINLQQNFGLTKLEAIRLRLSSSQIDTNLVIHRQIAHNRLDRTIPIITEDQKRCLANRAKLENTSHLLKQNDDALVGKLIDAELTEANIRLNINIRAIYALNRLNVLRETLEDSSALLALCSEMGFSSPRKIKQWLQ